MQKKHVTKIDPRKELSPYLNHQENRTKSKSKKSKVSASLSKLNSVRHRSLLKNLGIIVGGSFIAVLGLGYYVSPLANVKSVEVKGANDLVTKEIVSYSGIRPQDKVLDYKFNSKNLDKKLIKKYPEVQDVDIKVKHFNHLIFNVQERSTVAYIKEGNLYRKILPDGKLGTSLLPWSKIDQDKPLFIGYSHKTSLTDYLELFDSLPEDFRDKVKLLSGNTRRKSQIILVMKDNNVIIGDISTIKEKIKYYNNIRSKTKNDSLIDLEIGAFSRPLTRSEKKEYGIS